MKKSNLLTGIVCTSFLVLGIAAVSNTGISENIWSNVFRKGTPAEGYKLTLNKDNYATVEEAGTFGEPKSGDKLAVRKTELGNDITFQFCSGRGVTNNDASTGTRNKFCQMPGSQYGWITNKDALTGISKLKLTVEQPSAVFRVDLSSNHTLEDYYYSAAMPDYVSYRSNEYTGQSSYEINFNGNYEETYNKIINFKPFWK